jgi:hypothetical protein
MRFVHTVTYLIDGRQAGARFLLSHHASMADCATIIRALFPEAEIQVTTVDVTPEPRGNGSTPSILENLP